MDFRVLELFSGIGGMHCACKEAGLGFVVAAMDINTVANDVYKHNFPTTRVLNNNIQSLNPSTLDKLGVNMITMSPPCQPHTRVGLQKDIDDARSDAFQHICKILPQCRSVEYVLVENVKMFEKSQAHQSLIDSLNTAGFHYREFILSPRQFGIPNTRHRYYCIARRTADFPFEGSQIWERWPLEQAEESSDNNSTVKGYLESEDSIPAECYVEDKVLSKRVLLMDIASPESTNTMCFTKAYTHYAEGTGSIYSALSKEQLKDRFGQLEDCPEEERGSLLRSLRLRYFTPRECLRLMRFPEDFTFPPTTTRKQKYRLIGNSINVHVVSMLIKLLCS